MTVIRVASSIFALTVIAAGFFPIVVFSAARAQVVLGEDARPKQHDVRLGGDWYETEGAWTGTWTPMHPADYDGAYNAYWTTGNNQHENADLQIHIAGNWVLISRTQHNGACNYRGTFNAAGNVVTGTYSCDWNRAAQPWRATVSVNSLPSNTDERPSLTTPQILLMLPWLETEGAWRGTWTPSDADAADGRFAAHWAHERESARADLQISIDGGVSRAVTVRRTDPGGRTCTYHGLVTADFLTITGTYRCSDNMRQQLPWSARVQVPARH